MNGATIYIRDVANVRDGYTPQLNVVLANGIKGALLPALQARGGESRRRAGLIKGVYAESPPIDFYPKRQTHYERIS